jgi:hypothetical protein
MCLETENPNQAVLALFPSKDFVAAALERLNQLMGSTPEDAHVARQLEHCTCHGDEHCDYCIVAKALLYTYVGLYKLEGGR